MSAYKFKKGQEVKSGHHAFKFTVIGYKYDNHFLAVRRGEKDSITNRELLYDKHCWLEEGDG